MVLGRLTTPTGVDAALQDALDHSGLELLARSFAESVADEQAGDRSRTLAVMQAAIDIALAERMSQCVGRGHVQDAVPRTRRSPSGAHGGQP